MEILSFQLLERRHEGPFMIGDYVTSEENSPRPPFTKGE
jgi:hypothetical protein